MTEDRKRRQPEKANIKRRNYTLATREEERGRATANITIQKGGSFHRRMKGKYTKPNINRMIVPERNR